MRLYVEGEKSVGLCESCSRKVITTMTRRSYAEKGVAEPVPDVLLAVCDECGEVVGIPHQSTAKINAHRKNASVAMKSIGVRVSGDLEDTFYLVVYKVGGPSKLVQANLLRFYLNQVAASPSLAARLKECSAMFPAATPGDRRISVRMGISQIAEAKRAAKTVGCAVGDLLRSVVVLAAEDSGISYKDLQGHIVTPRPDAAGQQRFATMQTMAKVLG